MTGCARESEVVDAVLRRRTPEAELARHIEQCDVCRDAAAITSVLRDDRDWLRSDELPVPAAGQVWWRAAVRMRLEGTQAAARPLTWAHGVASAATAGAAIAALTMAWPTIRRAAGWLGARLSTLNPPDVNVTELVASATQRSVPFALAVAAALLLAPLALYAALSDE